jgi:glycosyltransferase involved in cell wall biosynthesis
MMVWLGQLGHLSFHRLLPEAKLFHATEHLLMPLRDVATVLTVHDLIFKLLPEHHKPLNRWYLNWTLPLYCHRADHVIAVSEATKQDLLNYYDLPEEKVSVIYEAAAPRFTPQSQERQAQVRTIYGLPQHYLLMVGTIEPRKNLTRVLHAWTPLYQAGLVPPLVIVGKRGWLYDEFFEALTSCPVREAVVLPGFVADEDLPAVYSGATALIWASLYEGFGLPPLEAMASGAPVVCADTSSLPEVVGDAALMFDPFDEDALATVLRHISDDAELRDELRGRGFRRAQQFSWERTAQETIAVYDQLIGSG